MRYLKILFVSMTLLPPAAGFSQQSLLSLGFWNVSALSGEFKLGGLYGTGDINTYGINNKLTTTNYYGGLMVKTSSFIWNPNFLKVDIDGGYYPESRQDMYLVSPNINNAINTSKLHFGATLFPKKVITLSSHLNYDNSYDSRENLTDIKTKSKTFGTTFSFKNKYAPLSLNYNESNWDSREVLTSRDFNYIQKTIDGRISKSFSRSDKSDLMYVHNDYYRRDYNMAAIRNVSDNIELQNGVFLDSSRKSYFNSNIFGTIQTGNDSFKQFRANENFIYQLPHHFTFNCSYSYSYMDRSAEKLGQHSITTMVGHQLFESLHSDVLFEYIDARESSYHEINDKGGLDLNYTKKTFADGLLNITYSYNRIFEKRNSTDVILNIMNEEYTISDRVLFKRPYVIISSVVIKDATGTTIYQEGLDYVLNQVGSFLEIQRIPGGLIQANTKIYVFYNATQPGSYDFSINQSNFSFNYSLFKGLLNLYFKTNRSDYSNIHHADNLLLNYLTDDLYGSSIKWKAAVLGVEYDDYQSNLVPYNLVRYYLTWQGNVNQRILYSINANWRDYKIPTEATDRIYRDISGMFSYAFSKKSKMDITVGYQSQEGKQINLDLVMLRAKYSTMIKKINLVVGVDSYNRSYLDNQKTNYAGAYVQIIKKFKY